MAAVLLNTSTKLIESEFHHYIRPVKNSKLSDFCKRLTGIEQDVVDNAETFPEIYKLLCEWLDKIKNEKNLKFPSTSESEIANVAFSSWTSYDFKDFLRRDFQFHNISMPDKMKSWIDLKVLFKVNHF